MSRIHVGLAPNIRLEDLGFLPHWLNDDDPHSASEQINANYAHGGGWQPFEGFKLDTTNNAFTITYPGDPTYRPIAAIPLPKHDEIVLMYPYGWVGIWNRKTNRFEIARID